MISQIWGLGGQALGWNGSPLKAPMEIPFIITGGSNIVPTYTYDLGSSWLSVDVSGFGTPLTAAYGWTGQYKHVWSFNGINMFFTSYNSTQSKSRVWYSNNGGKTMSYFDLTDAATYNARQFGTWTVDNSKAYITGWTNMAKVNYSTDNFLNVYESSTGQGNGN